MSTAVFELAHSIPSRLSELFILTDKAKTVQDCEPELYNALCRSCCVLLASHLEGFLKELTSRIISDLNDNTSGFAQLPYSVQRTFCLKIAEFEGVSPKETESKVRQLITFFTKNSVLVDMKAFPYKESVNKNPSNTFIDASLEKIGVPSALSLLDLPAFKTAFQNDDRLTYQLNRKLRRLISHFHSYPFRTLPESYRPTKSIIAKGKLGQSLWYAFIEELMIRRHKIAHGDTLSNEASWEDLKQDAEKLKALMYGLIFAVCSFVGTNTP